MFRKTSNQASLLEPAVSLLPAKQARLEKSWGWLFRLHCLPRIAEADFASAYCADNGRPNTSVRLLVALLILKDVFDLTDQEALDAAEFDLRWQTALALTTEDKVPCQKTLYNFRLRLEVDDRAQQVFLRLTDELLALLGVDTGRQRLDSTQICSNIQLLSRLSRFCEAHRLLIHRLSRYAPALVEQIPAAVCARYVRADGTDSSYDDARSSEGRRRLAVCARDAWRLVDALRGVRLPEAAQEAYTLVERLLTEQCLELADPATPLADDADATEPLVAVRLREKGEVAAGGLQTPHDPDATYGHKGVGYTVTICETVGNGDVPELLTHLVVTTASASDQLQTLPTVEALQQRGHQPKELLTDGSFGSTTNLLACQALGTTLVAPVTGGAGEPSDRPRIYVACLPEASPSACSQGVLACSTHSTTGKTHTTYTVRFAAEGCTGCPQAAVCPARARADGTRVFRTSAHDAVNTLRRWRETQPDYLERYRWRSGIEATNSEMKRGQGLGRLRVRRLSRVTVSVFLKGTACNVKRALKYWARQLHELKANTNQWGAFDRYGLTRGVKQVLRARWGVIGPLAEMPLDMAA
jgi:hypothetical protein